MDLKTTEKRLDWLTSNINKPLESQRKKLSMILVNLDTLDMREENAAQARKLGWATAKELRQVIDALEEIAHKCEQL